VGPATRRRVQAAATHLGYAPNRMASALRTQTSPFIGIVVPDITIPFYGFAVKAAQDVLEKAGYQALVMNSDRVPQKEREALQTLISHRARGVLLATSGGFESSAQLPVVFFSNFEASAQVPRVALSNREGVKILVEHLIGHGHRRILYIGGRTTVASGSERHDSFNEVMRGAGLEDQMSIWISDDSWSATSAYEAVLDAWSRPDPPTAILAAGDMFALGALKALRTLALRVPDDVAVVTFQDPDRVGGIVDPPLTTLASYERELGQYAATLLLHVLDGQFDATSAIEARMPATLIIRRSCGCTPTDTDGSKIKQAVTSPLVD